MMENMQKYRTLLLNIKSETESRILSAHNEQINSTDSVEEVDQVQDRTAKSVLAKMLEKDSLKLRHISEAIKKIDSGEYGECNNCGCDIEEKRLIALPLAKNCVMCQEIIDRRK